MLDVDRSFLLTSAGLPSPRADPRAAEVRSKTIPIHQAAYPWNTLPLASPRLASNSAVYTALSQLLRFVFSTLTLLVCCLEFLLYFIQALQLQIQGSLWQDGFAKLTWEPEWCHTDQQLALWKKCR